MNDGGPALDETVRNLIAAAECALAYLEDEVDYGVLDKHPAYLLVGKIRITIAAAKAKISERDKDQATTPLKGAE